MGALQSLTDMELTELLAAGDSKAVEEVYNRFSESMLTHANMMLKDRDAAKDVVANVFVRLLTSTTGREFRSSIEAFLYGCVRHEVLNQFRHDQYRMQYAAHLKAYYEETELATDKVVMGNEMQRRINEAVDSLPPKMREIYELSRSKNLSRKQVAEAAQVTEGTVNTQLNRAFKILKSRLTVFFIWF